MANYVLAREAFKDLEEIWEYTFSTWSEIQADTYHELLTGAFTALAKNPALGKSYAAIRSDLLGIRAGQHIIFYQKGNENQIQIIRILHIRMDWNSHIKL